MLRRDAGTYALYAQWIAHPARLPVDAHLAAFGGPAALADPSFTLASPAYYQVIHDGGAVVVPQFLLGSPALFSLGWWAGGWTGLFLVPAIIGGLAVLAVAALAARLTGPATAPLVAAAVAVTQPVLHASRSTYSEPAALLLVAAAAGLLTAAARAGGGVARRLGWAAGAGFGLAGLFRVDALREVILLAPLAALLAARRHPAAAPVLLGGRWRTGGRGGPGRPAVPALPGLDRRLAAAAAGRRPGAGRRGRGRWSGGGRRRRPPPWRCRRAPGTAGRPAGWRRPPSVAGRLGEPAAVDRRPAGPGRPRLPVRRRAAAAPGPAGGRRADLRRARRRLDLLVDRAGRAAAGPGRHGWVALAVPGTADHPVGARSAAVPGWLGPLLVGPGSTWLTLYRPGITPDHPWADRRLVPVVLPAVLIAAAAGGWPGGCACSRRSMPARVYGLTLGVVVGGPAGARGGGHAPVAGQRTERGEPAAVAAVCRQIPLDAAVLAVDRRGRNEWPQLVRGVCGRPAASVLAPAGAGAAQRAAVAAAAARVLAAGRRPVLLAADPETGERTLRGLGVRPGRRWTC